jgi:hypothetical protein
VVEELLAAPVPVEPQTEPRVSPKRPARPARATPAPNELGAELALLNGAQWALRQGQPAQALSMAREHAARFPGGSLREERAGIEALARCALGHDGARVVQELEQSAPASPLMMRVRTACGAK